MKRFILFFTLITAFSTSTLFAQKKILVADYFESSDADFDYASNIRNQVISGIQATNRLTIIDSNNESCLQGDIDDATKLQIIQELGASFIMIGSLDALSVEKKTTDSGNVYYNSELKITLKFFDANDNSLYTSKSLTTYGGGILGSGSTEQKAINGAVSAVQGKMERIIDEHFALKGTIVETHEVKKNKLMSCYINLGSDLGVAKGQYLKVLQIKEIAGRRSATEIGRLRVEETLAEDLSDCKVIKGQEEILTAINGGSEIVVETIKARGVMGGLDSLVE